MKFLLGVIAFLFPFWALAQKQMPTDIDLKTAYCLSLVHKVSAKYLPLYVNEFEFRYNNRMNADIFGAVIRAC